MRLVPGRKGAKRSIKGLKEAFIEVIIGQSGRKIGLQTIGKKVCLKKKLKIIKNVL